VIDISIIKPTYESRYHQLKTQNLTYTVSRTSATKNMQI